MPAQQHVLSIVIPALNEEAAIGSTVQRCLEARAHICAESPVSHVEILVVSDGSTDRTEEIARSFDEVTVLAFDKNRGYGAAIQCGFAHATGDLVSFLDADGTCDPRIFADLCRELATERADVVLGSRLGKDSQMPRVRAIGNTIFAWILGLLSKQPVGDTASGMRVIRRSALPDLYPLPSGLHFTPAMSARILLEQKLRLREVPMPYAERVGRSKLSVVKDGVRFLTVIVRAAMCYRPSRPLLLVAALLGFVGVLFGLGPAWFYVNHARLEEWMIYRILVSALILTCTFLVVCAAALAERIAASAHGRPPLSGGAIGVLLRALQPAPRRAAMAVLAVLAIAIVWPGIVEYATTLHVQMHWSRAVLASLLVVFVAMLSITAFLMNMIDLIHAQQALERPIEPPTRLRAAARRKAGASTH
jgi:glycosyltransferase involved in cell wall biosynthesis